MEIWWSARDAVLMGSVAAMGLAGSWHCALMCGPLIGASCAKSTPTGFLVARVLSYALAGGALAGASSSASSFVVHGGAGPLSHWLTIWAVAHAAVVVMGLFMAVTGRQPRWLATLGRQGEPASVSAPAVVRWAARAPGGRWVARAPGGAAWAAAGGLWVLLPCGLLQSALVVATLGSGATAGATIMAGFGLITAPALFAAPILRAWVRRQQPADHWQNRLTRISGGMLAAASGWALVQGLWTHIRDYC